MEIGIGIAILGVWLLPTAAMLSNTGTGTSVWVGIFVAAATTVYLVSSA